jgi:hypothetical protein
MMDDLQFEQVETRLREMAAGYNYPPVPDIRSRVLPRLNPYAATKRFQKQRLAWTLVVILAVAAGMLAVPPVRAQFLEFLQVGAVRINLVAPAEAPATTPLSETLTPDASLLPALQAIAGETDLHTAQERVSFPIRLPAYPTDLGEPDRVFLQDMAGPLVVLVWMEPHQPDQVRVSLHLIAPGSYAVGKSMPRTIEMAEVNGQSAVWAEGPYLLTLRNGTVDNYRLIDGHVLIWEDGDLTYRLETDLPLEEAVRIAGSLR